MSHDAAVAEGHHEPRYLFQFVKLAIITAVEVGVALAAAHDKFGDSRWIALALLAVLSLWKAGIVGRHYMHLAYERRPLVVLAIFPFLFIVVLFVGFLLDHVILGQGVR